MTQLSKRSCPLCGGNEAEELHRLKLSLFEGHPLAGDCVTVVCRTCGMAYSGETLSPEAYERYYAELSKYTVSTSAKAPVPRLPECAEIFERLFPKDAAILDAGCGSGGVLAALKNKGFTRLSGLDATPECVKIIRDELGLDARVGMLDSSPFPPASFDVVFSTVVFEHLLNPGLDIDRMGALLKDDGLMFVLVPDAISYGQFIEFPFQDVNVEHISHFSATTLDKLFLSRGWERVEGGQDLFKYSATWQMTLVWGLYRKGGKPQSPVGDDASLKAALKDYFARSAALLENMINNLQQDLAGEKELIIWGAGHTASVLLAYGGFAGKRLRAVIDSNPNYKGRRLAGAPVGGFETKGDFGGPIVVTTVRERDAVLEQIGKLTWKNRIVCIRP